MDALGGRAPLTASRCDLGQALPLPGQLPPRVATLDPKCIPRLLSWSSWGKDRDGRCELHSASFLGKVKEGGAGPFTKLFSSPLILRCCQCPRSGVPGPDLTRQLEKLRPRAVWWHRVAVASQGPSGPRERVKVTGGAVNWLSPWRACSFQGRAGRPACHRSRAGGIKTPHLSLCPLLAHNSLCQRKSDKVTAAPGGLRQPRPTMRTHLPVCTHPMPRRIAGGSGACHLGPQPKRQHFVSLGQPGRRKGTLSRPAGP